ncbi:WecB/TagA/CpsF family glycosyltransferase [Luminiphilus sp.]|nr:WecB/TagA/CpsF family glycosyltransferase [Luminiphilus sp.]
MRNVIIFNAESAFFYCRSQTFRRFVSAATELHCDSASLSGVLSLRGIAHARSHGPDFMESVLRESSDEPIAVIGGSSIAHLKLKEKFGLTNTFFFSGRVDNDSTPYLFEDILKFSPRYIFLCLGLYKQERISSEFLNFAKSKGEFQEGTIAGVGAAIDFLGETKIRAGITWQALGLEWLPRLVREPRMFPRLFRSLFGCLYFVRLPLIEVSSLPWVPCDACEPR